MDIYVQKLITVSPKKLMGKNCSEIHLSGTNLNIPFINNDENLSMDKKFLISLKEIKNEIRTIKKNVNTIIIKNGEPCLQRLALKTLCKFIKSEGMFVALETYGTKPNVLNNLLEEKLIDIVILKLYFPIQERWLSKINKGTLLTNNKDIISDIKKSIGILSRYTNIKLHVVTKIVPSFLYRTTDLNRIGNLIKNIHHCIWELIPFNPEDSNNNFSHVKSPSEEFIEELKEHMNSNFPMIHVR